MPKEKWDEVGERDGKEEKVVGKEDEVLAPLCRHHSMLYKATRYGERCSITNCWNRAVGEDPRTNTRVCQGSLALEIVGCSGG